MRRLLVSPTLRRPSGKTMLGGREYLMPKFAAILPTPETTGDFEEMCLAAGESAALVNTIAPAQVIVQMIVKEAEEILEQHSAAMASIHQKRSLPSLGGGHALIVQAPSSCRLTALVFEANRCALLAFRAGFSRVEVLRLCVSLFFRANGLERHKVQTRSC